MLSYRLFRNPAMLVVLGASALQGQTGTISGRVASAGRPVARAEIGLVDGLVRTTADDSGRFVLRSVPSGRIALFVRAIGYLPEKVTIEVPAGGNVERDFELRAAALELPELKSEARWAKPARLAHTTKYDDFYRRRRSGLGTFLTRDQIERSTALRTFELLRAIPGIKVIWQPPGVPGTEVRFTRCAAFPPKISVWIDGRKQVFQAGGSTGSGATMPPGRQGSIDAELTERERLSRAWLDLFDAVRPSEIESMEVFRGVAQIPAEYLDDNCAAVAIWTRDGSPDTP